MSPVVGFVRSAARCTAMTAVAHVQLLVEAMAWLGVCPDAGRLRTRMIERPLAEAAMMF